MKSTKVGAFRKRRRCRLIQSIRKIESPRSLFIRIISFFFHYVINIMINTWTNEIQGLETSQRSSIIESNQEHCLNLKLH